MGRVRLDIQRVRLSRHAGAPNPQPYGIPFLSTDGGVPLLRYLPWYRLLVRMFVEPNVGEVIEDELGFDAILDTGAPLTCIPFDIWQPFADHIRWLDQPPREDVDDAGEPLTWRIAVGGGAWSYRLGRVRLGLRDGDRGVIPSERTTCMFLDAANTTAGPRPPRQPVLGLRSPLLERRQLRHAGSAPDELPVYWLEDA